MSSEAKLASHEVRLDLGSQTFDQLLLIVGDQSNDIRDLRLRVKRLEGEAGQPDLAESVANGVKHDAELIQMTIRAAQLAECKHTLRQMDTQGQPTAGLPPLYGYLRQRIRELEQAEGRTDDE